MIAALPSSWCYGLCVRHMYVWDQCRLRLVQQYQNVGPDDPELSASPLFFSSTGSAYLVYFNYSPCVLSSVFSLAFSMLIIWFVLLLTSIFRFLFGPRLFHPVFFSWVLFCLLGFGFCSQTRLAYDTYRDIRIGTIRTLISSFSLSDGYLPFFSAIIVCI